MMRSPVFKIVGSILVALAVLMFLFHGTVGSPPPPTIHSTLPSGQTPGK
jgi:hypothetical protein